MKIDLFCGERGTVNGFTVEISRDSLGYRLRTSSGLTGRLICEEPAQHWYLVNLIATGFIATVHRADWLQAQVAVVEQEVRAA